MNKFILIDGEYTTLVLSPTETQALMKDLLFNYGGRLVTHNTKKELYDYLRLFFKGELNDLP